MNWRSNIYSLLQLRCSAYRHDYLHCRDVIVSLLKEKMNGSVQSVTRLSKALEILRTHSIIVLAFLDTLEVLFTFLLTCQQGYFSFKKLMITGRFLLNTVH